MTPALKRLIHEPGNDMIVIPFHHQMRLSRFIPICDDRGVYAMIAHDYYDPDHYPPGSCIQ